MIKNPSLSHSLFFFPSLCLLLEEKSGKKSNFYLLEYFNPALCALVPSLELKCQKQITNPALLEWSLISFIAGLEHLKIECVKIELGLALSVLWVQEFAPGEKGWVFLDCGTHKGRRRQESHWGFSKRTQLPVGKSSPISQGLGSSRVTLELWWLLGTLGC